jgi:uncharacterized protein with PIN domain
MLKRLARWLRLLGADVICDDRLSGAEALRLARLEGRAMLTRDKRLRTAPDVLYLETQNFRDQLREVMMRFPFDPRQHAFSRCSVCNEPVKKVPREIVQWRVPPFVLASQESFAVCERCGRIYWGATHPERALRELGSIGL